MTHSKYAVWTTFALGMTLAACSDGGATNGPNAVQTVVQNLTLDPSGHTTVISLRKSAGTLSAANFEADGGQAPVSVLVSGSSVAVTWDERVTPDHEVRLINVDGLPDDFVPVTTTNANAPTFTITSGQQNPGLGGDVLMAQFSGARLVEAQAEDESNWELRVGDVALSLDGSTLDYNPLTGVFSIVTGPGANLHSSFTLAALSVQSVADVELATTAVNGAASGDTGVPTLVSAEQNLAEDEFGRVVDFTFSEAMDPVFAADAGLFTANSPDLALLVTQPSDEVLRVRFNNPIVPGVDDVTLTGLVDVHGNALANQTTAVAAVNTVANDFDVTPQLITVENAGGDYLEITFQQALDPDDAGDAAHWEVLYDAGGGLAPYDLSSATLDYDLLTKTLTIQLADDFLNGQEFLFAAASLNEPLDVDGELFFGFDLGTVTGDVTPPAPLTAVQRRNLDSSGRTLDIRFSEDLDEASAETLVNWSVGALNIQTATLITPRVVRLTVDDAAVPGDVTIAIQDLLDLAGNTLTPVAALAFGSSDTREPAVNAVLARAIEGLENDTLFVAFDDTLVESEIEDPSTWVFESPVGTLLDLSGATVSWDSGARTATLVLGAASGIDLQRDADFSLSWSGVRDLGGNALSATPTTGEIDAEIVLPSVIAVWVDGVTPSHVWLRFSEPCRKLDDLSGLTEYEIYDNTGLLKGAAVNALPEADGLGVELIFPFAVITGSDTLGLRGVQDAAGNPLFAASDLVTQPEAGAAPALDTLASSLTAVTGERNDTIELVFDRPLSPWGLLDAGNFVIELSGQPLDQAETTWSFDGVDTVTIALNGPSAASLQTGAVYDVTYQNIVSAQGVAQVGSTTVALTAGGDAFPPALPAGWARLDSASPTDTLLVTFDEAVDSVSAEDVGNYLLNGATAPDSVVLLAQRTVRLDFSGGVTVGDTLDFTAIADLAGNLGLGSRAVSAADVSGPLVLGASAISTPGAGGDQVRVQFNRTMLLSSVLQPQAYTVRVGSQTYDTSSAQVAWESGSFSVVLTLPAGEDLPFGAVVNVGVVGVTDVSGMALNPAASINALVTGDNVAPDFAAAFLNLRFSPSGNTVDVRFSEAVDAAFALDALNWTVSGGVSVLAVEQRSADHFRLELSAPLPLGGQLALSGLPDIAGNESGAISIVVAR
jgi:hypothetical protein